jgi:hypothetical protein
MIAVRPPLLARDLLAVSHEFRAAPAGDHGAFDSRDRARLRRHRASFADPGVRRCMSADAAC